MDFKGLFGHIASLKVGVVGDVMLDTYMWGNVDRISPEAPVPIVSLQKKEYRIGGAGNVALNIQSLAAKAFVITVTGKDEDAACLKNLLATNGINTEYALQSAGRLTTNKTRIIGRNQQMMRLDAEITTDLTGAEEEALLENFNRFVRDHHPDIVILQDYNKGVLTEHVIQSVIATCRKKGVLTAVDPKRKNFFVYKGVDLFKPNLKEAREALNLIPSPVEEKVMRGIHQRLHAELGHHISFITLSEKGVFYQDSKDAAIIPSHLRNVADVSGAGDTVIATASLVYAATKDIKLMAEVSNIAGGLVCEEVGTAAIDKEKLLHECEVLLA